MEVPCFFVEKIHRLSVISLPNLNMASVQTFWNVTDLFPFSFEKRKNERMNLGENEGMSLSPLAHRSQEHFRVDDVGPLLVATEKLLSWFRR